MMRHVLAVVAMCTAVPAAAFEPVTERGAFLELVGGRTLTAMGVALQVLPDGGITGRAFGADVRGRWQWQGGMFCRELFAAGRAYPRNCQTVARDGKVVRFTADEGTGDRADLRLK